ncbi:TMV resistance protein N [Trifolium repens]|nr:TMV resistance protein N [Trifolium repens]
MLVLVSSLQTSFAAIIGELRKKNNELELEVCELRKLKEKWVDNSIALPELPSKRWKDAQGASSSSSVTTLTRGATVDASHFWHGHPITSLARHAHVVEERQENDNVHMSEPEEVIVMDSVVVPPSDVQEEIATQNKAKRKGFAINASPNSFDNFRFISSVHQERYSKFLTSKRFLIEQNLRFEGSGYANIKAMIVARGWVELTSFAKVASTTLAKEFFANAYQGPAKEYGNDKNDRKQFTSFVRGKMVPFDDKVINQLFGLENYEQCSFEARRAMPRCPYSVADSDILGKPKFASWILNKDEMPEKLRISILTPIARAWATFVSRNLLPCSNHKALPIQQTTLVIAILKGEPVNVGRLLADDLWGTANCSSPSSYLSHASLINKLCERVGVYPEKDEEMVKPYRAITADWIKYENTDGAAKSNTTMAGCGGILRNDNDNWITGFSKFLGNTSAYMAEVWGLYEGLSMARSLGIERLEVQVDSEALVKAIKKMEWVVP